MHATLLTYGSQGDVEPFVALGAGLLQAGHGVRLLAPETFAHLAVAHGLEVVGLPGEPLSLVQNLVEKAGRNPLRMVSEMSQYVVPLATRIMERVQAACGETDVIIHSFLFTHAGYEVARGLGVPDISAQFFPVFSSTREFPSPAFPDLPLGAFYRRASHWLTTQTFRQGGRVLYWWVRRSNPHLPGLTGWPFDRRNERPSPLLYAFSPHVVTPPADWPSEAHVTGYWFLEELGDWKPPEVLTRFLADGPKPACITLGSSTGAGVDRIGNLASDALALSGQRGIVVGRDLDPKNLPSNVLSIDYVPYGWLFSRVSCAVHHGGAGTTGQALRAGVPSIVVPFTSDQPFWGSRVHRLGAGPRPIPAQKLSASALAGAIRTVVASDSMRSRAREIGARIRTEDGVGTAVKIIQRHAEGGISEE